MKVCTKCKVEKQKAEFYKDRRAKSGLRSDCKSCMEEQKREYRQANAGAIAAKSSAYYVDNKAKIAVKSRAYYVENADTISAKNRAYYTDNAETILVRHREYNAANPEKCAAIHRNRRARKRAAEGIHTSADIKAIFESQRGKCASCQKKLIKSGENKYHVDHIQPLSKGGSNWPANLQCLCPTCNLRKNAKDPIDWAKENWKLL